MLDSRWSLLEEVKSRKTLFGLFQIRKIVRIGLKIGQFVSQIKRNDSFKTSPCRYEIMAGTVQGGKEPEHRSFGWLVAELDVMFRGVVETALCSGQVALIQKALAELAIGHGESFFIPDDPVIVEGLFKQRDRLLPLSLTSLLQRQIVMENAERAIVV